jgi:hypothetical protein
MRSVINDDFRESFARLPKHIQRQAREAYQRFLISPDQPGLNFKKIHSSLSIYSIRVTRSYRALGVLEDETIIWFWIGSHAQYDKILSQYK